MRKRKKTAVYMYALDKGVGYGQVMFMVGSLVSAIICLYSTLMSIRCIIASESEMVDLLILAINLYLMFILVYCVGRNKSLVRFARSICLYETARTKIQVTFAYAITTVVAILFLGTGPFIIFCWHSVQGNFKGFIEFIIWFIIKSLVVVAWCCIIGERSSVLNEREFYG